MINPSNGGGGAFFAQPPTTATPKTKIRITFRKPVLHRVHPPGVPFNELTIYRTSPPHFLTPTPRTNTFSSHPPPALPATTNASSSSSVQPASLRANLFASPPFFAYHIPMKHTFPI